jgi:antitoxin ParD1/3/4
MEKETLTISLPRATKAFIKAKLHEGRFSTPSEYIRSLVRVDQEKSEQRELDAFVRRGLRAKQLPELSEKDWASVEALIMKCGRNRRSSAIDHRRDSTEGNQSIEA